MESNRIISSAGQRKNFSLILNKLVNRRNLVRVVFSGYFLKLFHPLAFTMWLAQPKAFTIWWRSEFFAFMTERLELIKLRLYMFLRKISQHGGRADFYLKTNSIIATMSPSLAYTPAWTLTFLSCELWRFYPVPLLLRSPNLFAFSTQPYFTEHCSRAFGLRRIGIYLLFPLILWHSLWWYKPSANGYSPSLWPPSTTSTYRHRSRVLP